MKIKKLAVINMVSDRGGSVLDRRLELNVDSFEPVQEWLDSHGFSLKLRPKGSILSASHLITDTYSLAHKPSGLIFGFLYEGDPPGKVSIHSALDLSPNSVGGQNAACLSLLESLANALQAHAAEYSEESVTMSEYGKRLRGY